ncbi:putative porin [Paucimonas lemoignei]|uniref:Putative porin n=2 Tax=Paucimonas lemoignei TaxID=29443 RepID=A0A4R3HRE6_PAULE|nr:putative porin [Paucimonas lemoignei]
MKKSLLALAVLGAFAAGTAQAQTNVSIGGILQANVKNYKVSSTTRVANNELRVDDDYNSRFWLTGTEDLGGGLSALFYVENRFNTDQRQSTGSGLSTNGATGAGLADGDTFVGLKGGFGQVTFGKHSWMSVQGLTTEFMTGTNGFSAMPTSMTATYSIMNQTGLGNGGGVTAGQPQGGTLVGGFSYLDTTRRINSITYRSPVIAGFSGVVGFSPNSAGPEGTINGTTNYDDGQEYYLQAGYNNGPLALGLAYRNVEAEGRSGFDDQQLRFTGSYKFAGVKVGLIVDRAKRELVANGAVQAGANTFHRTAWSIPVSYAFGNSTILANFTKAGDRSGVADSGAKMYTIGYDYALSKRTNVGVFYSRLDNDTNGAYQPFLANTSFTGSGLQNGETASTFALGVKHTF